MKSLQYKFVTIIIAAILSTAKINAQVSTPFNFGAPGDYVGWNAAQGFSLNITHRANQNINLRTNYGTATPGLGNRMIITNGGFGAGGGQIAMGNNLPDGFTPTARLHLHQDAGNVFMKYSTPVTGSGVNQGLLTGIANNGQAIFANYTSDQPITFFTENLPPVVTFERIRINADNRNGFIGMGNSGNFAASSQLQSFLNVFADDLSNGIYSYALVVDGQVIDTKQMVKSK